jgi:uncharacterized membrane protein (DUF2068 family)
MAHEQPTKADIYGLRSVASLELLKGMAAVTAGIMLALHPHASFGHIAERILHAVHIRRSSMIAIEIISWARKIQIEHLQMVLFFVGIYALFRVVEAWGLWHAREWAEWFGILNGALYLPIELIELHRHFTALKLSVLVVNVIVVAYLVWELRKTRLQKSRDRVPERPIVPGRETVI